MRSSSQAESGTACFCYSHLLCLLFSAVWRMHRGNTTADTLGCILCGEKVVNGYLYNSTPYELELTSMLKQEVTRGNTIYLDIVKYEEESR